jgi:hypothetical protein
MHRIVSAAYPKHEWVAWRFIHKPTGFWDDKSTRKDFFKWVGTNLGIRCLDDWYSISFNDISRFPGGTQPSTVWVR